MLVVVVGVDFGAGVALLVVVEGAGVALLVVVEGAGVALLVVVEGVDVDGAGDACFLNCRL